MAKKSGGIPLTERQVMEQPLSLPQATGPGRMAEALGGLSNILGNMNVNLQVEDAVLQGAKDRLEGGPRKLAPGINKATAAYNQAFLNMDNELNLLTLDEQLKLSYLESSKPGNLNAESPGKYAEIARKQIDGVMSNVTPQNQAAFALQAAKMATNYGLQLQYMANQKSAQDIANNGALALNKIGEDYANAIRLEQPGLAQDYHEQFMSTLKDVKQLTGMDALTEQKYKDGLRQTEITSQFYKRGQNDAIARPGDVEKQLFDFASSPPEGLTPLEQDTAIKAYVQGVTATLGLKERQTTLDGLEVKNLIDNGTIKTDAQLSQYDESLPAADFLKLKSYLYKKQLKGLGGQIAVNNFLERAKLGGGLQNLRTKDETKEVAFVQLKNAYIEKKRDVAGDSTLELSPQDEANVLKQLNTNVPSIDARMNYALGSSDPKSELGNAAWAMAMFRALNKNNPDTMKLTAKNRAIALAVNSTMLYGGQSDLGIALDAARKKVNASDADKTGREATFRNKTKKEILSDFSKIFPDADPNMDKTSYGAFLENYELYYLLNDDDEQALEATRQVMQNTYGKSKWFQKGRVGFLPLEKVIAGTELGGGVWLDNQIKLLAYQVAENHKNASTDELDPTNKVEWVGSALPAEISRGFQEKGQVRKLAEDDLFNYGLAWGALPDKHPTGIAYKIRGQERTVYVESDSLSRVGDGDNLNIRFYTINPNTKLKEYVVDPKSKSGFANPIVEPLPKFLPNLYKDLTNENINEWAGNVVAEEYKQKKKIPIARLFGFADFVRERKPEIIKQLKAGEKETKAKEPLANIDVFEALVEYSNQSETE